MLVKLETGVQLQRQKKFRKGSRWVDRWQVMLGGCDRQTAVIQTETVGHAELKSQGSWAVSQVSQVSDGRSAQGGSYTLSLV